MTEEEPSRRHPFLSLVVIDGKAVCSRPRLAAHDGGITPVAAWLGYVPVARRILCVRLGFSVPRLAVASGLPTSSTNNSRRRISSPGPASTSLVLPRVCLLESICKYGVIRIFAVCFVQYAVAPSASHHQRCLVRAEVLTRKVWD